MGKLLKRLLKPFTRLTEVEEAKDHDKEYVSPSTARNRRRNERKRRAANVKKLNKSESQGRPNRRYRGWYSW